MYKTESTLGLVGSIIGAVLSFLFLIGTLLVIFFFNFFEPFIHGAFNQFAADHIMRFGWTYENIVTFGVPVIAVCAAAALVIAAASFILGFIGTAKLNRDDKNGGVLLIVGGALALISIVGFIPFVLMLIGGIMAISRKPAVSAQAEVSKTV
jgi:hypothetical protein